MIQENKKNMVTELHTAYLSLVHACCICNMADEKEKKTLFRLKEEVYAIYMEKYEQAREAAETKEEQ